MARTRILALLAVVGWAGMANALTLAPGGVFLTYKIVAQNDTDSAVLSTTAFDNLVLAVDADVQDSGTQVAMALNATMSQVPILDLSFSASYQEFFFGLRPISGNGRAQLSYSVALDPLDPANTATDPVPVSVSAAGSIALTAPSDEFAPPPAGNPQGYVRGSFRVSLRFDDDSLFLTRAEIGNGRGCGGGGICQIQPNIEVTGSGTGPFRPGRSYSVGMSADILAGAGKAGVPYEAQAVVDPVFSFVNPDDANRYRFVYSPNLFTSGTPTPAVIPLPASLWLMLGALAALTGFRKRAACAMIFSVISSTASAATLIEILPGGPLPLPDEKAEAAIAARVNFFGEPPTENTIGEQIPEVKAKATVEAGISAGFTPVSGALDTLVLGQSKPAKINFSFSGSTDDGEFSSLEKRAVAQSLVTVPNLFASPVVDTIAEATVQRSQSFDLFNDEQFAAFANGALAYQAKIDQVNFQALGFDVPAVPLSVTIKSDLNATLEPVGVDASGALAQSTASALVVGSTSAVTTTDEGTLSYSAEPALTTILFANSVAAGIGSGEFVPEAFFGEPTIVSVDVPPDQTFFLGKEARSSISLNLKSANGELTGFAQAIVDPVLSFDQDRFNDLYGNDCFDALGAACPAMDTLFSLSLSPFVGNGDAPYVPQVLPGNPVTPVPLPPGAWLILSGLTMLSITAYRPSKLCFARS